VGCWGIAAEGEAGAAIDVPQPQPLVQLGAGQQVDGQQLTSAQQPLLHPQQPPR
jgi:hypothetical protein